MPKRVLIVDDDLDFGQSIVVLLTRRDYQVQFVHSSADAFQAAQESEFQVALIDLRLGRENGLELLGELKKTHPAILCVVITAYAEIENAIEALKLGAYDYLRKPISPLVLYAALERCFDRIELERKKEELEAQLRQAQKLEAVGQLASGVAHDFNNILTAIMGYAETSLSDLRDDPLAGTSVRHGLQEIGRSAQHAAALTRQLLTFSRRDITQPKVLDLNALLSNTEKMLRRLISEDIALDLTLTPGLPHIFADAGQIEQVAMNLVVNARDAMVNGGKLALATSSETLDEAYVAAHHGARPGPHVVLTIRDTGCGMDAATIARIFDPFFTTKPAGLGTGLGLATVHGIIKEAGGHITIDSQPSQGTTFRVYIPAATSPPESPGALSEESTEATGTESILVCEDHDSVRNLLIRMLRSVGYSVLAAENGHQALNVAQAHAGRIDLLITDVILPDTDGKKLAGRLAAMEPNLKILFTSGYASDVVAQRGVLEAGVNFLEKPFNLQTLLRRVRETLDQAPAEHSRG